MLWTGTSHLEIRSWNRVTTYLLRNILCRPHSRETTETQRRTSRKAKYGLGVVCTTITSVVLNARRTPNRFMRLLRYIWGSSYSIHAEDYVTHFHFVQIPSTFQTSRIRKVEPRNSISGKLTSNGVLSACDVLAERVRIDWLYCELAIIIIIIIMLFGSFRFAWQTFLTHSMRYV